MRGEDSAEDLGTHAEGGMPGEDGMKEWLYAIIRLKGGWVVEGREGAVAVEDGRSRGHSL